MSENRRKWIFLAVASLFVVAELAIRFAGFPSSTKHTPTRSSHRASETSTRPKTENAFRIVVFGGAVVAGEGVAESARYTSLLERELNDPSSKSAPRSIIYGNGYQRVDVVNMGVPGWSLEQSLQRLDTMGAELAPDLIVYGFSLDDIRNDTYVNTFDESQDRHQPWSALLATLQSIGSTFRDLFSPARESYIGELDLNYFANEETWEPFVQRLTETSVFAFSHDACAVMLVHTEPTYLNRFHPFLRHYYAAKEAAINLYTIESFARFQSNDAGELRLAGARSLPNEAGHALLVEALLDGLTGIAAECWKPN